MPGVKSGEQYRGWAQLNAGAGGDGNPARGRALVEEHGSVKQALYMAHPDQNPDAREDDFRDVIAFRDREGS